MKGIELFERIQQVFTFAELLQSINGKTKAETLSKRGNVFEKVCDIIIKFGFCSILPNDIYDHYEGNIALCKLKKVADLEMYIKKMKVFSKGKGGSSDITLKNKKTDKWIFISSKFGDGLSVDQYDIEKINSDLKEINKEMKSVKSDISYIKRHLDKFLKAKEEKLIGELQAKQEGWWIW